MPKAFIRTQSFENKAIVYKTPSSQTLSQGLADKTQTKVGELWYAEPENIELFKFDIVGQDIKQKTFVFFRENSFFQLSDFERIILKFNSKFLKGDYKIHKFEKFSIYYKTFLKKA